MKLSRLIAIHRLPVGRRMFAMRKTVPLVEGDPELLERVRASMTHDQAVLDGQTRWMQAKNMKDTAWPARVRELNSEHDSLIAAIENVLSGMAQGLAGTAKGEAAARVHAAMFPDGVVPLTHREFVVQREVTDTWLKRLRTEFSKDVEVATIGPMVDRLEAVNNEFGQLMDAHTPAQSMNYEDLQVADAKGQELMLAVVAKILGKYDRDEVMRDQLLAPVLQQHNEVSKKRRQRRRPTDVNPTTGEELNADNDG